MCDRFYRLVDGAFESSIPKTRTVNNSRGTKYPPWFTWDMICDCKLKEKYRVKLKKNQSTYLKDQYNGLRSSLKHRIKKAFENYQKESESNLINNPKGFRTFMNNSKKQNQYPTNFYIMDSICCDPQVITNSFADFFSSVFTPLDKRLEQTGTLSGARHLDNPAPLDESVVFEYIKKLPSKMSAGVDGIPCALVKDCARCFSKPLSIIFKRSIACGTFPAV